MDWKDLAGPLITVGAPTLGKIIGGALPIPGGSLIGEWAGRTIADALGVPATPDSIHDAIAKDPDAAQAALANAESEWARASAEIGKVQAAEIAQTMRAELGADTWLQKSWRPVYGLATTVEMGAFAATIIHAIWFQQKLAIGILDELFWFLLAYVGMRLGVLGVYVQGRTREKEALAIGQVAPGMVSQFIGKVAKGR